MSGKAVVLWSGGLDSTTALAMAKSEGFEIHALTVDYSQRHSREIEVAKRAAEKLELAEHKIIRVDLSAFGGSILIGNAEKFLTSPPPHPPTSPHPHIPPTYVPARNTVLLSLALAWAEALGARDIFIGANAVDYSGYPDCRPEFIEAFERLANLATKAGVEGDRFRIRAPLIGMTKAEIIKKGMELGVDFSLTHSCYDPDEAGRACGRCDSCLLRLKGFGEAGIEDPVEYRKRKKR